MESAHPGISTSSVLCRPCAPSCLLQVCLPRGRPVCLPAHTLCLCMCPGLSLAHAHSPLTPSLCAGDHSLWRAGGRLESPCLSSLLWRGFGVK